MKPQEIRELLSLGEGSTLEFKTSLRARENIGKVACGFLNASGGFVLCGIDDQGRVPGDDSSDAQIAAFEQFLRESIHPSALIAVQREILEGKPIIVIEVPKGSDPPYSFRHIHYLRGGARSLVMDQSTLREIILRSQIEPERWERRFSTADPVEDVDREEVLKAVRETEKVRRAVLADPTDPLRILQDLDVAKYGRLTNAGDVLFTARPSARHPQTRIRAMRYNSDKAGEEFSDMKSFEGPLNRVFEDAYSFIVRNTPSVSRFIKGQPRREDAPLYPETAVREGLINALAHRDYASPSGGVAIHIYPRRLEIWNSGALPEGVTQESLQKGQISVLRNPDIAHVLYLRGFMEKAGRGSVLIINACAENGLPQPQWSSDPTRGVTLTFIARPNGPKSAPSQHQVGTKSAPSRHQVDILRKCLKESAIVELMEVAGRSDRTKFRNQVLKPMLEANWVEMTIPDKPTSSQQRYRTTPSGKALLEQQS